MDKDGQQQESTDLDTKTASETPEKKDNPVKDVPRTEECKVEETVKTESESKVEEELKVKSIPATAELGMTLKRISDNCIESFETKENSRVSASDAGEDTSSEDHAISDSEDDEEENVSAEEDEENERENTKERNIHEAGKVEEEESDDGDDTDDDLKVVLASACIEEEEEEDSEGEYARCSFYILYLSLVLTLHPFFLCHFNLFMQCLKLRLIGNIQFPQSPLAATLNLLEESIPFSEKWMNM